MAWMFMDFMDISKLLETLEKGMPLETSAPIFIPFVWWQNTPYLESAMLTTWTGFPDISHYRVKI